MVKLRVTGGRQARVLLLVMVVPFAASVPFVSAQAPAPAATIAADDPSVLPSEIMPRASRSLLLGVAKSSAGYFVVGERGHVLHSLDGKAWTQLKVPTRSTLTSLAVIDNQVWVAGHNGVILHSADAGKTWQAQRRDPYALAAGEQAYDHDPRQGAPILDIHFSDASNGIAVGAHSLLLITGDGGATWTPRVAIAASVAPVAEAAPMEGDIFSEEDLQLGEEADPHLNAVVGAGPGALVIVGERGTFLRSTDAGETWQKLGFPYKGSMFGVLSWGDGRLVAYGLRGNVYESKDLGSSWNKVETQGSTSLMGGLALADGAAVLVGANGTVLRRAAFGAAFEPSTYKNANDETPALAGIAPVGGGEYVLVGDKGVDRYHLQ
ncbi:MAG: hypothetical protein KAY12_03460 [Arenimonas sp.]|nr:hypothetical protein [Arenimonas sp.]